MIEILLRSGAVSVHGNTAAADPNLTHSVAVARDA
jgi:hypothetical protein